MRKTLESEKNAKLVAIEPEPGDVFVAESFDEAVGAASSTYPHRVSHTIKIGAVAAFYIGMMVE